MKVTSSVISINQSILTLEQELGSNSKMTYAGEIRRAMKWLAEEHNATFLGQAVEYPGTAMTGTLADVPEDQLQEMPVAEDLQLGLSIGIALAGGLPISIFPRWNFFLLATNQLVNHLDKIPLYSTYRPKVIIRVGIGATTPLDPGPQHSGDLTEAFELLCETVKIIKLTRTESIFDHYQNAVIADYSTIFVECMDKY